MLAIAQSPSSWSARPAPASLTRRGLRRLVETHLADTDTHMCVLSVKLGWKPGELGRVLTEQTLREDSWATLARHFGYEPNQYATNTYRRTL